MKNNEKNRIGWKIRPSRYALSILDLAVTALLQLGNFRRYKSVGSIMPAAYEGAMRITRRSRILVDAFGRVLVAYLSVIFATKFLRIYLTIGSRKIFRPPRFLPRR